ncbi:hypothetical protein KSP39_PZI009176 [Platanthera zijinensis]|uniref:Uncharacterized protein n=1 Tax=Platanthera zijinensis TaxID=2320716 RepID=A0AAP0BJL8_9ASPA
MHVHRPGARPCIAPFVRNARSLRMRTECMHLQQPPSSAASRPPPSPPPATAVAVQPALGARTAPGHLSAMSFVVTTFGYRIYSPEQLWRRIRRIRYSCTEDFVGRRLYIALLSVIPPIGKCLYLGEIVMSKFCRIMASITLASIMAKFMPGHILGPIMNDMKAMGCFDAFETPSENRLGSN